MELLSPNTIQLINSLILSNTNLGQIANKSLGSFSIFLRLQSIILDLVLAVFLALVGVGLLLDFWGEDCGGGEDFVKVLELLSGFLLVGVVDLLLVYLGQVRESVHDESPKQHRVRHLIVLD